MIVLAKRAGGFPDGYPRALGHVADEVSEPAPSGAIRSASEVRARIDGKMMRLSCRQGPLAYQVLDGLHHA